ncbi:immunoglobulin I-set domain protein, partial [Ostertagia ostertagi]
KEPDEKKEDKKKVAVPEFEVTPKVDTVELEYGKSGELRVKSSHPAQFQWTKHGQSLPSDYSISGDKTSSIVKIPLANQESAGEYICTAAGPEGKTVTACITVIVKGKPIVEPETSTVAVKIGESAKLYAGIQSATTVKCEWKKDGKPIKLDVTQAPSPNADS